MRNNRSVSLLAVMSFVCLSTACAGTESSEDRLSIDPSTQALSGTFRASNELLLTFEASVAVDGTPVVIVRSGGRDVVSTESDGTSQVQRIAGVSIERALKDMQSSEIVRAEVMSETWLALRELMEALQLRIGHELTIRSSMLQLLAQLLETGDQFAVAEGEQAYGCYSYCAWSCAVCPSWAWYPGGCSYWEWSCCAVGTYCDCNLGRC